uniref:Putative secreted protein n=1 Tax=Ixodes ricinus TaxID=34613 RepID=A0A6B0UHX3_IXORI
MALERRTVFTVCSWLVATRCPAMCRTSECKSVCGSTETTLSGRCATPPTGDCCTPPATAGWSGGIDATPTGTSIWARCTGTRGTSRTWTSLPTTST